MTYTWWLLSTLNGMILHLENRIQVVPLVDRFPPFDLGRRAFWSSIQSWNPTCLLHFAVVMALRSATSRLVRWLISPFLEPCLATNPQLLKNLRLWQWVRWLRWQRFNKEPLGKSHSQHQRGQITAPWHGFLNELLVRNPINGKPFSWSSLRMVVCFTCIFGRWVCLWTRLSQAYDTQWPNDRNMATMATNRTGVGGVQNCVCKWNGYHLKTVRGKTTGFF